METSLKLVGQPFTELLKAACESVHSEFLQRHGLKTWETEIKLTYADDVPFLDVRFPGITDSVRKTFSVNNVEVDIRHNLNQLLEASLRQVN